MTLPPAIPPAMGNPAGSAGRPPGDRSAVLRVVRHLGLVLILVSWPWVPGGFPGGLARAQESFQGKVIRKISITGLRRLEEPEILQRLRLRIGQTYDANAVSNEAGRLYLTGYFSSVDHPRVRDFEDGVEVIFPVKEKALVRSLKFDVVDSSSRKPSVSQRDLQEAISTKTRGLLSEYSVRSDVEHVVQAYRERGYLFAEVDHLIRDLEDGVEVVFIVKEGPRVRIRDITFSGNQTVGAGTLRGQMATKEKDIFFFGLLNPGTYDQAELDRDIQRIKEYYHGLGFFEVLVAVEKLEFYDQNRRLRVHIGIEEGPRYTFSRYRFEGNLVFSTPTLLGLSRAREGRHFSAERMEQDRLEILKYYRDRAYIDASVEPTLIFPEEGTTAEVLIRINEGHEIYIDHVHVQGNLKTRDGVIRRELEFYPGEKFNWSRLEKSRSNLARLQIFRSVDYDLTPGSAPNRRDVVVKIQEEATGRLLLGFGVTSGFGFIGNFSVTKRNFDITDLPDSIYEIPDSFTGAGQTLRLVLQPGTRRSLYQFSFTEPYLFGSRNALTLSASRITILRRDFDEDRLSFLPSIDHAFDFDRDLVFSVGARLEEVDISNIDKNAADEIFDVEGKTSIVAGNVSLAYDKVLYEPFEGPYAGHREWVSYEYGGEPVGGHLDFTKFQSSLELYYPIYVHEESRLHHVISLFSKFGTIEGHHDTHVIPIFERFFLGGPNTVRGFRFRGLGPHSTGTNFKGRKSRGDPLGGTMAWYGNVEYVFPLFQKFVRGVVFLDYGNLSPSADDFNLQQMRLAAGAGVRINFPLFGAPLPIGLYFGKAFESEREDRQRTFLFTIGAPF